MLADPTAARIATFLQQIGIEVERAELDAAECFLPGLSVERGRLLVDEEDLAYPGDLLHEAGHIAMAPPEARAAMSGGVDVPGVDMGELEVAALAWSYAAALAIGIDPALVFHSGGYHGKSAGLLRTYSVGVYPGANLLVAAGMTTAYPEMQRWLR